MPQPVGHAKSQLTDPASSFEAVQVKRVTEFEDFTTCWPSDQLKAEGLVARVRQVVNVRDSFTRMKQERDGERQERLQTVRAEADANSGDGKSVKACGGGWLA
jgi:hypothetical protein